MLFENRNKQVMKKINFHLIAVIVVLMTLLVVNWQFANQTFVFFGFAENKELEIRVEHDVMVGKIHVTPGNEVKKGDVLLELSRSGLQLTQSDLNHNVANLQSQLALWETQIRGSISRLEAQKAARQSSIQSKIDQLKSELEMNQSLVKDFKSIDSSKIENKKSPNWVRIQGLKRELDLSIQPIIAEVRKLKAELFAPQNPLKIQISKLKGELDYVHKEEQKLVLKAPNDGIVGTIYCKVGEQFSSFSTLMSFYEQTPTQVKGYVLESLILNVKMGDEVSVNSVVQFENTCIGQVVGMGSRIVEIPSRLQKNPTIRAYGREIIIAIPADNKFLQKEKVILKIPSPEDRPKKGVATSSKTAENSF